MNFKHVVLVAAVLVCLFSLNAFGQPSVVSETVTTAYPRGVTIGGGTGFVVFQDIQVPNNTDAGVRGDGKGSAEEYQNHVGLALHGDVGFFFQEKNWNYEFGLHVLQARSTSGPAATQSSSYARYVLGGSATYQLSSPWHLGPTLGVRRSSFDNVSTGHFIESVTVGVTSGVDLSRDWQLGGDVSFAPQADFFYNSGKGWAGKRFENGKTSLAEYKFVSRHRLHENTWLSLGIEQEVARVDIPDVAEYNTFGLNVSPSDQPARAYDLATTLLSVGFDKRF